MRDNRHHWPALEPANQAELLAHLGASPLAEGEATAEVTWVVTGIDSNDHNGVVWARFAGADAGARIAALVDRFRASGPPALWHLDAASRPADLAERLAAVGCRRLAPGVCMTAALRELPVPAAAPGLTVERVADASALAAWMDVWGTLDDGPRAPRERLYASLGLGAERPLQLYLARLDGEPAAVSQLFLGRAAAGLYCVTTRPDARRRGVGTAVVLAALRAARARGYEVAVLGPTPESRAMYARLGFALHASPFVGYTL
jgi:ribosomal protein S18 acetylase RimI-like enzyme